MACPTCAMIRGLLMAGGMSETVANEIGYSKTVEGLDTRVQEKAKKVVKRKATAWTRYLKAEMPKMRRKFPRSKPTQLMKKVAKAWKTSTKNPNRKRKVRRS